MWSDPLIGLTAVAGLGIIAQWVAWRLRVPAILLLLLTGFLFGPVLGVVRPDELFGDLLFPGVALAVGLILFEGGLSLKVSELSSIGTSLRNLVTLGALVTWLLTAIAARVFLGFDIQLSLLLGAVLVVTGPTVIMPLLRHIQPREPVGSILKWEGILIDPLGATLALLVFESILLADSGHAFTGIAAAIIKTILAGGVLGMAGGYVLTFLLRRYWVPDYLQNPVSLLFVIAAFAISDTLQHESGLLAVTVMGIYIANQPHVEIRHIVEFKENLRVLLISVLFIVLAGRLDFNDMRALPWGSIVFLIIVIGLVRPASVFASTRGTTLALRDKLFLSWMAPRGIVAASVSTVFALRLTELGHPGAELLVPATFLVIIGTVTVYGLTAPIVATRLELAQSNPRGLLFLSAVPWVRDLGVCLQSENVPIVVADTNRSNIQAARMAGLGTYYGNILSSHGTAEANLSGIGRFLALTPNNDTNALACKHFESVFDRSRVYQLGMPEITNRSNGERPRHLLGRELFGKGVTYSMLSQRVAQGWEFKVTPLTETFDFDSFTKHYGEGAIPLLVIGKDRVPEPLTRDGGIRPLPGTSLVSLVDPESKSADTHD